MNNETKKLNMLSLPVIFIFLPLFLYATGDFPRRSFLKEAISVLTIIAFCLMLAQFFLMRRANIGRGGHKLRKILTIHKLIGYFFVTILLVHPFLMVVPRYFESGIDDSMDAFRIIITSFDSSGVILGIVSWFLMVILTVTSLFRNVLPLTYIKWRKIHGLLSMAFMTIATSHAISIGRHTNIPLSLYMIALLTSGGLLLLESHIVTSPLRRELIRE